MYCSNCGSQIQAELNLCNRCGTKVFKIGSETQKSAADNLSASLGYIGGFGLLSFIFVALVLVKNGVTEKALILISLFYLGALSGICFLILQQIRRSSEKAATREIDLPNDFQINQIGAASTARLQEAKQTPISITENTTGTLDEVLVKRN